jgi:carboxymethylenebutenolidase
MTQLQRYLAEEIVEDHADGILTRREAMRRLGLLGIGAAAASALLSEPASARAKRSSKRGSRRARSASSGGVTERTWEPVTTQEITFDGPRGTLMAAWAPAENPRGGLLVIHENRGLTDHIRTVAGRYAASGYSSLALDLLSEEGGTGSFEDEAQIPAALAGIPPERFVEDMKGAVTELRARLPHEQVAATGFCFGGGMVWLLLTNGEDRLAAASPFYGPFPEGGSLKGTKAAVLAVYGGLDDRVNATRDEATAALEAAGRQHEVLTFGGANHAFFNDTGQRFNVAAAAEAYRRVVAWLDRYVAARDD